MDEKLYENVIRGKCTTQKKAAKMKRMKTEEEKNTNLFAHTTISRNYIRPQTESLQKVRGEKPYFF